MAARGANAFSAFAQEVRLATERLAADPSTVDSAAVAGLLDGHAASRLRELVALDVRRADGVFFTGSALRERLLDGWDVPPTGVVLDPACGAADLLLPLARRLPLECDAAATAAAWGRRLAGTDVHAEFVAAARARLALLAVWRHAQRDGNVRGRAAVDPETAFPLVRVGDGLAALGSAARDGVAAVVCNPPFDSRPAPDGYLLGSGRTTRAAVFVDAAVEHLPAGAPVAAILPDVLRTGSRYARFRARLEASCDLDPPDICLPQFDAHTDVHVFLLKGRTRTLGPGRAPVGWWAGSGGPTVGDRFRVMVGPVVDNRDADEGPELAYLKAAELPIRGEHRPAARTRRHPGRQFVPPFVVVRRTSRPSRGSARAAGVLVRGDSPVHVDNHLLVAVPLSGGVAACRQLLRHLDSGFATEWLDARIRCRHVTVGALRDLPFAP